jgi:large subunit ribosomal protein L17e
MAIKGMTLRKAQSYLGAVLEHKRAIPFRRFKGGVGRTAQAKEFPGVTQARWPKKSVEHVLGLLKNAEASAEVFIILDQVIINKPCRLRV